MAEFHFLHLTDLHIGSSTQRAYWPGSKEEFYEDLKWSHDMAGPWDAVLFTGDLTQKADPAEFEALTSELDVIFKHLKHLGSTPAFLAVPGNHDLLRNAVPNSQKTALRAWHTNPEVSQHFWAKKDYHEIYEGAFAQFTDWFGKFRKRHGIDDSRIKHGVLPGEFFVRLESSDKMSVGVIGLNTAFLHLSDNFTEGTLAIDKLQLHALTNQNPGAWCRNHDLNLLLTHHPPTWFGKNSLDEFNAEIFRPQWFDLYLYGHMHEPESIAVGRGGARTRHYLQGASLLGLKEYGSRNKKGKRIHGYSAIIVRKEDGKLTFEIFPRQLNTTSDGSSRFGPDRSFALNRWTQSIGIPDFAEGPRDPVTRYPRASRTHDSTAARLVARLAHRPDMTHVTVSVGEWRTVLDNLIYPLAENDDTRLVEVLVAYQLGELPRHLTKLRHKPDASIKAILANMWDEKLVQEYQRKYFDREANDIQDKLSESLKGLTGAKEIRNEDSILKAVGCAEYKCELSVGLTMQRITYSYYRLDDMAVIVPLDMKRNRDPSPYAWVVLQHVAPNVFTRYVEDFGRLWRDIEEKHGRLVGLS